MLWAYFAASCTKGTKCVKAMKSEEYRDSFEGKYVIDLR